MAIESVTKLVKLLNQCQLLEQPQLDAVQELRPRFRDPRALAQELLQRGWLTSYHVDKLFHKGSKRSDLVLGHYVLLEKIGEGGMGQVFKARHQKLNRVVAVKLVRPDCLDAHSLQRFQREIQAAAQLNHPNIVMAYDADQVGGIHFIAMEYVDGTDLGKLLKKSGKLSAPLASDYIRQAALGLQHAHETGMVHRDIKPSNLLLAHGSQPALVKILDMGVARIPRAGQGERNTTLTQLGAVVGTPDYTAPEQALDARTVDIRADIYSLGCTYYQLLTGQVPFPGGTGMEKLFKHQLEEAVSVETLVPTVPAAVAAVVRKMMAKKPEDRYSTPAEVAAALEPVSRAAAAPLPKKRKSGEVLAVGVTTAAGKQRFQPTQATSNDQTFAESPRNARLRRFSKRYLLLPLAALALLGGLLLAFGPRSTNIEAAKTGSERRIEPIASSPIRPVSPPLFRPVSLIRPFTLPTPRPEPSPVGQVKQTLDDLSHKQLSEEQQRDLPAEVVAVVGDKAANGTRQLPLMDCQFVGDGTVLLTAGVAQTKVASLVGPQSIMPLLPPEADGRPVRCLGSTPQYALVRNGQNLWAISVATGEFKGRWTLAEYSHALFSPSTIVVLGKDTIDVLDFPSLEQRKSLKSTHPITLMTSALSADGKTLAAVDLKGGLHKWDLESERQLDITAPPTRIQSVAVSPNGKMLAAVINQRAKMWSAETGKEQPLETPDQAVDLVQFSPDGATLMARSQHLVVLCRTSDGKQSFTRTLPNQDIGRAVFAPDGKSFAMSDMKNKQITLWDVATGESRSISLLLMAMNFSFSSDGRYLATANGNGTAYVLRLR